MRQHHAAVVCRSRENADRFYEGILGLKILKTSILGEELAETIFGMPRECQILLYGNDAMAVEVFIWDTGKSDSDPFTHLCLEVDSKMEFAGRCEAAGLKVKRVPRGESLLVFVRDYDGNLYEIKEAE